MEQFHFQFGEQVSNVNILKHMQKLTTPTVGNVCVKSASECLFLTTKMNVTTSIQT